MKVVVMKAVDRKADVKLIESLCGGLCEDEIEGADDGGKVCCVFRFDVGRQKTREISEIGIFTDLNSN